MPSTPGFFQRTGDSQVGSRKPSAQSSPYGVPYSQRRLAGTSLRPQDLYRAPYGPSLTSPGSEYLPLNAGPTASLGPGFQQLMAKTIVDELRRQDAARIAASNENSLATSKSDIEALDKIRATAFNDFHGTLGIVDPSLTVPISVALNRSFNANPPTSRYEALPTGTRQKLLSVQPGQWRKAAANMLSAINMELLMSGLGSAERIRLNVMQRQLHAFLNDTEKALAPIKEIDEDESEYWRYLTHSLMISLDANEENTSSRRSALSLRELRIAANHLANISRLDVRNLAFCTKVSSYGRFDEFKSYGFTPGQEVLLYVEVENFATETTSKKHETELQGEYTIFDTDRNRVASAGLPLDKQFSMNRRHDYFIAYRIFMPKKIESGHYLIQLTIEDIKGNKSNHSTLEFWIR
jgi:hypothetical protein